MNDEVNKQAVSNFFERFATGDVPGAIELLDDAVSWRVMGRAGGLPMSGDMDKVAIAELITGVRKVLPGGMTLTPTGWTIDGDRVALEMESYGEKADGTVYNNLYHFLITLSGGTLTSLREYMDTHHVKQVFMT